jgi:hypothetical protein
VRLLSLEEESGLSLPDDPDVVYESDVDWLAELAEADDRAERRREYEAEVADCCGGRAWDCIHWRGGR